MNAGYLHGYDPAERERLVRQARFLAPMVHEALPFEGARRLLEIGCGVGAQTEILLGRFPELHVTGIDRSPEQLTAARLSLDANPRTVGRQTLAEMDARSLAFPAGDFDSAFLCWVLEHVSDPSAVLAEAHRVLAKDAVIVCTEVLNSTFFVAPTGASLTSYWHRFNARQTALGGDPYVGAKLGNLLARTGFRAIEVVAKTFHFDDRAPDERHAHAAYFTELLMSAASELLAAGDVTDDEVAAMRADLARVAAPGGVFFYSFIRASARV